MFLHVPYVSKDPNIKVLGPKYYNMNGIVLGPYNLTIVPNEKYQVRRIRNAGPKQILSSRVCRPLGFLKQRLPLKTSDSLGLQFFLDPPSTLYRS